MASFSKGKEGRHIAEVIPILTSWWGDKFVKTPGSGALRWGNGHWTYGDLVPPESFPFVVECKFHVDMDLDSVIRKSVYQGKLCYYWYYQTIADSARASQDLGLILYPMMIYKENGKPNRLVLQADLFDRFPQCKQLQRIRVCEPDATEFVICDLKQFIALVPRTEVDAVLAR